MRPTGETPRRPARPRPEEPTVPPAGFRLVDVETVELEIEKLIDGGDGLGRHEGVPIFVPRAAPGDRVRVRLTERKPGYGRGEILELLVPGPDRREPPCPHFADCGGCDLQHLDEAAQLRHKSAAVWETLARLSGLKLPPPKAIVAGEAWGWRLRTQVHTATSEHDGVATVEVGYHARGSHRVVPVRRCPVLLPELERAVVGLAAALTPPAPQRIDLAVGDDGALGAAPPAGGIAGGELVRSVAGYDLRFDARCFFQGHAGLLEELVDQVVGEWEGESACDLYGGVGLFALPLAARYGRVTLVESDRLAVRYARRNARLAGRDNIQVVGQAVQSWIREGLADGVDRLVLDPPREGLGVLVRRLLLARRPHRLTYVSCHPAALARDLADLAEAYDVESVALLDLFPQTGHMEVVAQLVLRSGDALEER